MTRLSLTVRLFPLIMFFFSTFCVFKTKILLLCSFFCVYVCVDDKVEAFPVLKISPKDIVDTNGAGDAFVGGGNLIELHGSILKLDVCKYCMSCGFLRVRMWCRFPVSAGPGEVAGSVCEGCTLRCQRHHPKSRVHFPRKTRLQMNSHSAKQIRLTDLHYFTNPILN